MNKLNTLDFTGYQEIAYSTCTPACYTDEYLDLGYLSEVGELAGKLAKQVRGDEVTDKDIMGEIGDVAWMIAVKARLHNHKLSTENLFDCGFFNTVFDLYCNARVAHDLKFKILMNVCGKLGIDFYECLRINNEKLASRQQRGVIQGNGDNR